LPFFFRRTELLTECKTTEITFYPCEERQYSFFFDFIPKYWKDAEADNSIHRVCSLMRKMKVKTFGVEQVLDNIHITREFNALTKRCAGEVDREVYRVSFFNKSIGTVDVVDENHDQCFLGYIVIP
jgi:hypothetical protein